MEEGILIYASFNTYHALNSIDHERKMYITVVRMNFIHQAPFHDQKVLSDNTDIYPPIAGDEPSFSTRAMK